MYAGTYTSRHADPSNATLRVMGCPKYKLPSRSTTLVRQRLKNHGSGSKICSSSTSISTSSEHTSQRHALKTLFCECNSQTQQRVPRILNLVDSPIHHNTTHRAITHSPSHSAHKLTLPSSSTPTDSPRRMRKLSESQTSNDFVKRNGTRSEEYIAQQTKQHYRGCLVFLLPHRLTLRTHESRAHMYERQTRFLEVCLMSPSIKARDVR